MAIIGAGMTGLAAAHQLRSHGCRVVVLEAGPSVGGQVSSRRFGADMVEMGAEAVPLRAPGVSDLVSELGLTDSMRHPAPGGTLLSSRRGVVEMPAGVTPVGPTKLLPTITSRILSPIGLLRAGLEPFTSRPHPDDVSVGQFISERFGDEVGRAVVDPLLGGIHAADVDNFSLAVAAPALRQTVRKGESLVTGTLKRNAVATWSRIRHRPQPSGPRTPATATWEHGLVTLPEALAGDLTVHTNTRATGIRQVGHEWVVTVTGPRGIGSVAADDVIIATPARVAAALLSTAHPDASELLSRCESTTVATLVVRTDQVDHPIATAQTWFIGSEWSPLVRQVTNLSTKWHLSEPTLRIAMGRHGGTPIDDLSDDDLVTMTMAELERLGLSAHPHDHVIERHRGAMPQPVPGHRERMATLATILDDTGLHVGGAGIDGAGVGTAIVAGRRLARQITSKEEEK
ncbi:protoporphyrinogen oxidase [Cutibacterium avidum]|uniref:Coproporphyrinogen III oxidase n=2 Tax=Cutibacterium avidum TaxID=33010 RepID=A0A3E2DAC3_9ACTN|nr:protoporphyrinogen oxidase [Propionibacterium sp.]RFT42241.1 protoporphyrinogen oxidase [Cutibacterium avidum]TMT45125.1 protoporphyrinogen oxidase [Cutibacterium avidum]